VDVDIRFESCRRVLGTEGGVVELVEERFEAMGREECIRGVEEVFGRRHDPRQPKAEMVMLGIGVDGGCRPKADGWLSGWWGTSGQDVP